VFGIDAAPPTIWQPKVENKFFNISKNQKRMISDAWRCSVYAMLVAD